MTLLQETQKVSVLYVDDDQENLDSFFAAFRREYEISLASSAQEALTILDRQNFQVLITDQRMPDMSGSELLESVSGRFPDMLRFILTGYSDFDPLVNALNEGKLQGYLTKPLDVPKIKNYIEKGLGEYYLKLQNKDLTHSLIESERQVKLQLAELEQVYAAAPVGLILVNHEFRIIRINEKLAEIDGCSVEDHLGKTLDEVVPELADTLKNIYRPVLETGEPVTNVAIHGATPKAPGLLRDWLCSYYPFRDNNGEILGVIGGVIEVTELKRAEAKAQKAESEKDHLTKQLRHAQKMEAIGTLAGGIAHDFNNILAPIIGYSEIIQEASTTESDNYEFAGEILTAGNRARELVKQILTFSRGQEQEKKPLKIQPVIKEALKLLRSSLPTSIELNHHIESNCGPVLADPTQMFQVIMNLCTNAYQSMQEQGGRLEVDVREIVTTEDDQLQFMELSPGKYIRVAVSDTGPGIEPDLLERIFEPYFTTKQMKSGTGLGLSVVHGIIKGHSGAIKVYSEPGQGTVFFIYLPCLIDKKTEAAPPLNDVIIGGTESVLLVDDEQAIVKVTRRILEKLGYQVTGLTDSRKALAQFKETPEAFDLIITDMTMPNLTGLELTKDVLRVREDIPVIICTGFSDLLHRQNAQKAGIRGIISKPIHKYEMAQKIREVMDR